MILFAISIIGNITATVPFIRNVIAVVRLHQQPQHMLATISVLF